MRMSARTLRLQNISSNKTIDDIRRDAQENLKDTDRPKIRLANLFPFSRVNNQAFVSEGVLDAGIAQQNNSQTATVTFASERHKEFAFRNVSKKQKKARTGPDIDDGFGGITVLYSGINNNTLDLDICAVHGLSGHAFDTWMAETKMWLRDLLPNQPQFQNSRIMTYGYNSTLNDKREMQSRFSDFADNLLVLLGDNRSSEEERARPLLLICHSMGGLVARLAMVRYKKYPHKYPGVVLGPCGLLLLSTPNAGSMVAEWSDFMIALAGSIAGVRPNLIKELQVLNPSHVDGVDDWETLENPPMVRCFCESSKTGSRQIVTTSSAGFLRNTAIMLPETDHHTVCKFERSTGPAFRIVIGCLCDMKEELRNRAARISPASVNIEPVGRPHISAPSYPLLGPHIFNNGFRKPRREIVGRRKLLEELTNLMGHSDTTNSILILTGMAGSGKTELLLKFVNEQSLRRNIVVLSAQSYADLRRKLEEYACMFGHDAIQGRFPYPGLSDRWRACSPKLQGDFFLEWAANVQNDCIIVLDELDDIKAAYEISNDIPQAARIAVSTRNPTVSRQLRSRFHCFDLAVFELEMEEARLLINSSMASNDLNITSTQTDRLANALDRHPLAICAASAYLPSLQRFQNPFEQESTVESLLDVLEGPGHEERKDFFDFNGLWGFSISELYASAVAHLMEQPVGATPNGSVWPLLQAIAFVSDRHHDCLFMEFFNSIKSSWRERIPKSYNLDVVLERGLMKEKTTIEKAIQSSLIIERQGQMYMPALWRDCIMLYECDSSDKRKYWLKQVLLLCYFHFQENESSQLLAPYVENSICIARRYGISQEDLLLHPDQKNWLVSTLNRRRGDKDFNDLLAECQQMEEAYRKPSSSVSIMSATCARLAKRFVDLESKYCAGATSSVLEQTRETRENIERLLIIVARAVGNPVWRNSLPMRLLDTGCSSEIIA